VTSVSLAELHRKSGHLSASDLEAWLRRSGLCKPEWSDALTDVCNSCACNEASRPKHHPVASRSQMKRPCELGVGIIFLRGFPILHAVDRYSTFSVTRVLTCRKSPEHFHVLDVVNDEFGRTARHAVRFRRMLCDQEFRKSPQVVEWTKSCSGCDAVESRRGLVAAEDKAGRCTYPFTQGRNKGDVVVLLNTNLKRRGKTLVETGMKIPKIMRKRQNIKHAKLCHGRGN
jgi:hypothetical protein